MEGERTEKKLPPGVKPHRCNPHLDALLDDPSRMVQLNTLKTLSNVVVHPDARAMLNNDKTVARLEELAAVEDRLASRAAATCLALVLWTP